MQAPVTIEAAILLVLASGPSHGSAILERLRRCAGGHMRMAEGSMYEHLHELEAQGLTIRALPVEDARRAGRPPIRYALTAEGRIRAREHRFFFKRLLRMVSEETGGEPRGPANSAAPEVDGG